MELQHITSPPLAYFGGNVTMMPLELEGLAPQLNFGGDTYYLKEEFHCSLVCVKCLRAELSRQVLEEVEVARRQHEPTFVGYRDELRHVTKDGRQSIVIMTDITNLEPIFEHLRKTLSIEIPLQPTHVTLYTTEPNHGIGIPSQQALADITELISGEKLKELKSAMNFDQVFGRELA